MTAALDSPARRKARGAFFTPPELSRYAAEWAVRGRDDLVLEPSCGEASFRLAAGERLTALRGSAPRPGQLAGVELHEHSAEQALALLSEADLPAAVTTGDFFHFPPRACYDAVVDNPPYVRARAGPLSSPRCSTSPGPRPIARFIQRPRPGPTPQPPPR